MRENGPRIVAVGGPNREGGWSAGDEHARLSAEVNQLGQHRAELADVLVVGPPVSLAEAFAVSRRLLDLLPGCAVVAVRLRGGAGCLLEARGVAPRVARPGDLRAAGHGWPEHAASALHARLVARHRRRREGAGG